MAVKAAGFLPGVVVGGWTVFATSRFVFTSEELKAELATGAPETVNAVVFPLSACAIWSGFSHQNWPRPASSWRSPKWSEGFTCPPNIHPSSLLLISLNVHSRACSFTWSRAPSGWPRSWNVWLRPSAEMSSSKTISSVRKIVFGNLPAVGEGDGVLGIGARRPGAGCGLVDFLLRLLRGGLLLVELAVQLLDLILGLPERLLEDPEPLLRGALRERLRRRTEQQKQRQASCHDPSSFPVRSVGHASSSTSRASACLRSLRLAA